MSKTYTIASFNIRFSEATCDGLNAWDNRKEEVRDLIGYYNWDIVGMQEVCDEQFDYLTSLENYDFEGEARDDGNNSEYCPIFYKKDLFEKEAGGTFWLSDTPDQMSRGWDAAINRICTWVRLKDKESGTVFMFLNTHLDHIGEEARVKSAELISEWIKDHGADLPVLLSGDFNVEPGEAPYAIISEQLVDTREKSVEKHYGPRGTFTDFDFYKRWTELLELDYLFVSDHVDVLKTRTIVDHFDRRYPSDHFPISALVKLGLF